MKSLIFLLVFLFATPIWAIDITDIEIVEDGQEYHAYFNVIEDGKTYPHSADIPKVNNGVDVDPQAWISANKELFYLNILKKQYHGAKPDRKSASDLQNFKEWIDSGAKNKEIEKIYNSKTGEIEEKEKIVVIKKESYKYKIPKKILLKKQYKAAKTIAEKLAIIEQILELK